MGYKSILTVQSELQDASAVFEAAAQLALSQDAHLEALCLGLDNSQVIYSYLGAAQVFNDSERARAEKSAREIEENLRKTVQKLSPTLRYSIDTALTLHGGILDLVALRARFVDLVVLGKPYSAQAPHEAEAILEAALFEGHATALILPHNHTLTKPRRIVLAWDQSAEALAAARAALPLLKTAERVIITIIDPPPHGPERSDPGGALCQMLVRHGVRAEVSVLAKTLPRVSEVILRQCRDIGADLLVMGAYGHSRWREALLGGATRDLLADADLPVLMAR